MFSKLTIIETFLFLDGVDMSSTESICAHHSAVQTPAVEELNTSYVRTKSSCTIRATTSDDDSDIEVLVGCNTPIEFTQSLIESAMRMEADVTSRDKTDHDWSQNGNDSLSGLESENRACVESTSPDGLDDCVLIDGYESDVESESSGYEELHHSL